MHDVEGTKAISAELVACTLGARRRPELVALTFAEQMAQALRPFVVWMQQVTEAFEASTPKNPSATAEVAPTTTTAPREETP